MWLNCVGCGKGARVGFFVWWLYVGKNRPKDGPYLHFQCWQDVKDQRRLDGLDETGNGPST